MELKEIKEKVSDIIKSIDNSKHGYAKRDFENFAEGAYNKTAGNKELLNKFDYQFKKNGLTLHQGDEEFKSIHEFSKGERITFRRRKVQPTSIEASLLTEGNFKKADWDYGASIEIENSESCISLYKHQEVAIEKLQSKIIDSNKTPFEGLLVLPTGGGKTLTAAYWVAKNYLDKGKKVLWIAHRHELLEQALRTFQLKLRFRDVMPNKGKLSYRIISGIHDRPVRIQPTDDLIISSKDSLNSNFRYLYDNWLKGNDEVFLVIDEAHHATAKTYRKLINSLKESVETFRLLGLTATPFRTAEDEQGLLARVFPDGIVHKEDLRTLISRGILSEPIFEEVKTGYEIIDSLKLTDDQLDKLQYFDIESIGRDAAKTIAENDHRNWAIINRYIKNKSKYQQTIIFALNVDNAIALNKLFQEQGIKSDYVVSALRDIATGATIKKDAAEAINRFREGKIEVLINVNILTEGTDLPNVQSVFLARPTISPVLMTQMIGRGLRGEAAQGTKNAYIVSFIDEWQNKVVWVNPEKLLIEENIDFNDKRKDVEKQLVRLVAISKIEEFASLTNKTMAPEKREELEKLDFIERVPLGLYHFSILLSVDNETHEKNCEVLVYDTTYRSYIDFIDALPSFFEENKITENENLTEDELEDFADQVEKDFFYGCPKYPAFHPQDIKDILQYYTQNEAEPKYIEFKNRSKFNLNKIAKEILDSGKNRKEEAEYITQLWEDNQTEWKAFLGYDPRYFYNEVDLAIRRLSRPELYQQKNTPPKITKEQRPYNLLSMEELKKADEAYARKLSDTVFNKHKDNEGNYVSATGKFKSKSKLNFQIDHILPFSQNGLTELSNLQILTRQEHAEKTRLENAANRANND